MNANSHEFWLEPENFITSSDSSIIHIKIGTEFIGTEFGFKKKFKDQYTNTIEPSKNKKKKKKFDNIFF